MDEVKLETVIKDLGVSQITELCMCLCDQAQQREAKLLEENSAYEKAILSCNSKIQEKSQEVEQLQNKLKVVNL